MANLYENTIEAVQHIPTEISHPVSAGLAVGAVGVAAYFANRHHAGTHEKGGHNARGIQSTIWATQEAMRANAIGTEKKDAKQQFSPVKQIAVGLGLSAVQFIGMPGYEATFPDADAEVMVIADASNSMTQTFDLGSKEVSRYDAVISGIEKSDFAGSMGFIKMGETVTMTSKPAKDWTTQIPLLKETAVDPNGGQLIEALTRSAEQISLNPETKKRSGTLILMSDGTVSNRTVDLAKKAEQLKAEGLTLKVITPGTAAGTYIDKETNTEAKSAVKPENLAMFDKSVDNPKTVAETIEMISQEIKSSGTRRERENWPLPGIIGVPIGLLGLGRLIKQRVNKD
ncbi:MAG: hypothetical protein JWO69_1958 [Thermoleophilia bacterium]|nr:hypothetical protein [Thermoleophilia bacterium]